MAALHPADNAVGLTQGPDGPELAQLRNNDRESSPVVWAAGAFLDMGKKSPRIARLAALQLSGSLLRVPRLTRLFLPEVLHLITFDPPMGTGGMGYGDVELDTEGAVHGGDLAELHRPPGVDALPGIAYHELAPRAAVLCLLEGLAAAGTGSQTPSAAAATGGGSPLPRHSQSQVVLALGAPAEYLAAARAVLAALVEAMDPATESSPTGPKVVIAPLISSGAGGPRGATADPENTWPPPNLLQQDYRMGSQAHRVKVRMWQAAALLIAGDAAPRHVNVLNLIDAWANMKEMPTVRLYIELGAAALLAKNPPLIRTWLMPKLKDYAVRPDVALTYTAIATHALLHMHPAQPDAAAEVSGGTARVSEKDAFFIAEMLAAMAPRAMEHHKPLRCFVQVAFNIFLERFGLLLGLGTNPSPAVSSGSYPSFAELFTMETARMYKQNPDLTRFFTQIETGVRAGRGTCPLGMFSVAHRVRPRSYS